MSFHRIIKPRACARALTLNKMFNSPRLCVYERTLVAAAAAMPQSYRRARIDAQIRVPVRALARVNSDRFRVCVWRRGRRLSRTRARGFGTCAPPTTTRQILQQPAAMNLLLWIRAHACPRTSSSGVHDHIRGLRAAGQTPTQIDRTACGRRAHLKRITFVTNDSRLQRRRRRRRPHGTALPHCIIAE